MTAAKPTKKQIAAEAAKCHDLREEIAASLIWMLTATVDEPLFQTAKHAVLDLGQAIDAVERAASEDAPEK